MLIVEKNFFPKPKHNYNGELNKTQNMHIANENVSSPFQLPFIHSNK